ncbi:DNA primase [Desulforamulus hydrothermalis]|uniref:DNA primase n=1 Tax=Desulforamulus hydrothermalis Lam5 = DSM 18033 TaxID=1121428 RepID=K8EKP2_9FIRM|nr:DNA primase [Desulforamulus hydrothermalis]CCO09116.1 DNA primase [Desulforamulus hydrothermalis Lam5 = DSM 18033]SHH12282.1 DNA primase [Desulforamulus hydrothermalis Lam5 = DSM 18033]
MAGRIPEAVLEEIRQRSDIVEIVARYVPLEKRGKNYLALCPFHQEKTPSFNVSQEKQAFHCFGCGVGGNVFSFIMMVEGLSFLDAVRFLAARAGVKIPAEASPAEQARQGKRDRAFKIYGLVRDFYRLLLGKEIGAGARRYLESRRLAESAAETFQLGYAPAGWDNLVKFLAARGIKTEEMVQLGLAQTRESGGCYDRFRNRVMFPIWDSQGRVVGFGGRTMGDDNPKYLNSPEGEFFNKGRLLYGLHIARRSIRELGYAILMEGYMDVVSAYQHGVANAVASLGTAFTREQAGLLTAYTNEVVIAYDADAAGIKAALRAAEILQQVGCQVRIASITGAKDPDEFIQKYGLAGWQKIIQQAAPLVQFKLLQAVKAHGLSNKRKILQEVLPNLAAVASPIELEEAVKQTATVLQVNWETVLEEIKSFKKNTRKISQIGDNSVKNSHNIASTRPAVPQQPRDARSQAEAGILRMALENRSWLERILAELGQQFFQNSDYQSIFNAYLAGGSDRSAAALFNLLDEPRQKILSSILLQELPGPITEQMLADFINTIKKLSDKARLEDLLARLAAAEQSGDTAQVRDLSQQIHILMNKLKWPERGVAT